jgi:hypothetical protein
MISAYAPPRANLDAPASDDVAERMQLLRHEKSIRGVGVLHLLGAILGSFSILLVAFGKLDATTAWIVLLIVGICALHGWIGVGLWRLDPRVRGIAGLMHGIGLFAFPIGTLVNAYILYLLFGQKGERVFSDEYRELVARTPDVRLPTSIVSIVLLGIVVSMLITAVIAALFAS